MGYEESIYDITFYLEILVLVEDATINWLRCCINSKFFPKFNSWSLYFQGSFYTQLGVHTNTLFPVGMDRLLLLISVIFAKESPSINILLATIKLAEIEQWSKHTTLQYSRQHKPMLLQRFLFLSNIRYMGDGTFLLFQFQVKDNH